MNGPIFQFSFSQDEVQILLDGLDELTHKRVKVLVQKMITEGQQQYQQYQQQQMVEQQKAAPAAAPAAESAVAVAAVQEPMAGPGAVGEMIG